MKLLAGGPQAHKVSVTIQPKSWRLEVAPTIAKPILRQAQYTAFVG